MIGLQREKRNPVTSSFRDPPAITLQAKKKAKADSPAPGRDSSSAGKVAAWCNWFSQYLMAYVESL